MRLRLNLTSPARRTAIAFALAAAVALAAQPYTPASPAEADRICTSSAPRPTYHLGSVTQMPSAATDDSICESGSLSGIRDDR